MLHPERHLQFQYAEGKLIDASYYMVDIIQIGLARCIAMVLV